MAAGQFVVIGAGTMGAGIAWVAATAGYQVTLVEPDVARAAGALPLLESFWSKAVTRGRMSESTAAEGQLRMSIVDSIGVAPAEAEVCIEAVPERLQLKREVLRAAEAMDHRLLATNTSSLSIGVLAEGLRRPEDFCGLHFFNPVASMALLEIVLGPATSERTRQGALAIADRLGKAPVVVADTPGFATSRLGVTLGLEAIRMLSEGVASVADIDRAMVLGYRHPMGPLEVTDLVGLDVRLDIARVLTAAYGARFAPPPLLVEKVIRGELGRKSGQGFYRWLDGQKLEE